MPINDTPQTQKDMKSNCCFVTVIEPLRESFSEKQYTPTMCEPQCVTPV